MGIPVQLTQEGGGGGTPGRSGLWGGFSWTQLRGDHPHPRLQQHDGKSRSICMSKSERLFGQKLCYLNAALPVPFPSLQLKQVAFGIGAAYFQLASSALPGAELGFTLYSWQNGWECDPGRGPCVGLHLRQLCQGLLVLLHEPPQPRAWGLRRGAVGARMEVPYEGKAQIC